MQEFTVTKKISDLKLKEELIEVYCYMDFNKQTIEPMYNDELKLNGMNILKLVHKQLSHLKLPLKKIFNLINDVKIVYDKEKTPDILTIQIYLK